MDYDKDHEKYLDGYSIYKELNDKEKNYIGSHFIESPFVVYRKVIYNDQSKAIGYIELIDIEKIKKFNDIYLSNSLFLTIMVHPEYRRFGIGKILIESAINWFKQQNEFDKIVYRVNRDNEKSINLAKKCGFKFYPYGEEPNKEFYILRK